MESFLPFLATLFSLLYGFGIGGIAAFLLVVD